VPFALVVIGLSISTLPAQHFPVGRRAVARPGPEASVIWKLAMHAYGHAAADPATAYFLSASHEVVAVSSHDGALRWRQPTGESDPVVGNGVQLAGSTLVAGDYNITAWDRETGTFRWRFVPSRGFGPGAYLGAVNDELVFAGSASGHLYGIELESGRTRWMRTIADGGQTVVYEPVLDRDLLAAAFATIATPTAGGLAVFEALSGRELWRVLFPVSANGIGVGAAGKPLMVSGLVIVANRDGVIHAFARDTGAPAWTLPALDVRLLPDSPVPAPPGPRPDFRALAASGRALFAGSLFGDVIAYDLDTRQERWRHLGGQNGSIGFHLSADTQTLYFPAFSGRLTAVHTATGVERWRIGDRDNMFLFPPVIAGDVAYATAFTGFYALRR
jgi:outer membrane protein assembly factor BamB